jgi:NO-binding membrane sensor protein with MHYT domain
MLAVQNFAYGPVTPAAAYLLSCLGTFLGLRCTARARQYTGAGRARWLALAAVSIGTMGIWVMHFAALLGFAIPGQTIRYNVPITLLSMLIAVVVVGGGLFITGFGPPGWRSMVPAGVITGAGVVSVHYSAMAALRMPAQMTYNIWLSLLSVVIGIIVSIGLFWAARELEELLSTIGAALLLGLALCGLHYLGMAGLRLLPPAAHAALSAGGATATGFLLPVICGITIVAFILVLTIGTSPAAWEIRNENALLELSRARGLEV